MFLAIAKLLEVLVARGRNRTADAGLSGRVPNRRSGLKSTDLTQDQELISSAL